ncbi:PREDICTED: uncharacterized protein LOC18587003 isoform X1 [Theobroma cacao]|uniref:Uncharacterized protein LOC18587003 isoform X1 n=1 Tax=Theobroma cacao TaxID=3641 RepID=A0AB32UMK2_THECC|nr:PREDICTED: uncharacterized protein LOC18587003 isoform X1 [Theobroma cacao]
MLCSVMSLSLKLTPNSALLFPHRGFNGFSSLSFPRICNSTSLVSQNFNKVSCSIGGDNNIVYGATDNGSYSTNNEGARMGKSESNEGESFSSKDSEPCNERNVRGESMQIQYLCLFLFFSVLKKLRRYGISGVLSYGLLNTAYYLTTFLLVWFYIAPVPGRMGYMAAVERFLKVMAMIWAGSQVTKLVRAGGALALAPFVDRALSWFTVKFKFESQGKASMVIIGFCFGLAFMLFLVVTVLWA